MMGKVFLIVDPMILIDKLRYSNSAYSIPSFRLAEMASFIHVRAR